MVSNHWEISGVILSKAGMLSDQELIKGCSKNDRGAQKALYDQYAPKLMAVCRRYAKSMQEAEDILQESYIKIFRSVKDFRGDSQLYYWMKRITVNTALNSQRSKLYLFPMVDVQEVVIPSTKELALQDYKLNDLMNMISELPDGCRVIFNLYAIEGYNHREIAKMLEVSEGTSKSQYARARQLLMARLDKEEKNYGNLR